MTLSKIFGRTSSWISGTQGLFRYKKPGRHSYTNYTTQRRQKNLWIINIAALLFVSGLCYFTIPFYKLYCEDVGLDGNSKQKDYSKLGKVNKMRKFDVKFQADVDPTMNWSFTPVQSTVRVHAGETALAFYRATNHGNQPVIGIATYSIYPEKASNYFNKIQCFCFNQQMINVGETVDLPLYFYLDPLIATDHRLEKITEVSIIYRFLPSKNQKIAQIFHEQNIKESEQKLFLVSKRLEIAEEEKNQDALARLKQQQSEIQEELERLKSTVVDDDFGL